MTFDELALAGLDSSFAPFNDDRANPAAEGKTPGLGDALQARPRSRLL
jgi:hypothetical protein